jgi:alpha-L-fucosidase
MTKIWINKFLLLLIIVLFSCTNTNDRSKNIATDKHGQTIPDWFKDGKFGMFIHWGPYSVLGGEWNGKRIEQGDIAEWIMERFHIPVEEYRKVAATFNPVKFNAREWVALAKKAGMKYIIITSKHHDGFAMFDSKVSDYNIVDYTPFRRDPLKELSEACAEAGIKFCVYYSHREDWENPYAYGNFWDFDSSQTSLDTMRYPALFRKYLDAKAIPQVKELLTNYGPLGIVWFDRGMYTQEQGKEFADLVHSLQPDCLVNGRVGHYDKELLGDYQSLTDNGMPIGGIEEYWETPQTLNDTWGYSKYDQNWKKPGEIIRRLVTIASKGGNYLLNIGPTGEGIIPQPSVDILKRVGEWMDLNKESIYGTSPSPFTSEKTWGYCTRKENILYLHIFEWPEDNILKVEGLNNRVEKAYMLVNKEKALVVNKDANGQILINLPENPTDSINSVLVLEIKGIPDVDPFVIEQTGEDTIKLDYVSAATYGNAAKRFNRKGEGQQFHISKMEGPDDIIEWHVNVKSPGKYDVLITYAAISGWEGCSYVVKSPWEQIKGTVKSTKGWYEYKTEKIGQFNIKKPGEAIFRIHPENRLDHYLMYFSEICMVPIDNAGL